jgi:hypothetical protein
MVRSSGLPRSKDFVQGPFATSCISRTRPHSTHLTGTFSRLSHIFTKQWGHLEERSTDYFRRLNTQIIGKMATHAPSRDVFPFLSLPLTVSNVSINSRTAACQTAVNRDTRANMSLASSAFARKYITKLEPFHSLTIPSSWKIHARCCHSLNHNRLQ